MDKLKVAHDWAMKMIEGNIRAADASDLIERAWKYADAMQAEADDRKAEQDKKDAEDHNRMMEAFANPMKKVKEQQEQRNYHDALVDIGLEEWQPDWSQAPKSMDYFFMNKDGSKYWTVNKPDKPNLSEHVMDCLECGGDCYAYASSQDYQGNWQDSLRKRP